MNDCRTIRIRAIFGAALAAVFSACVSRTLFVESDPTGAEVSLDGQLIGETPLEQGFTHYGTRRIRVAADGYLPHEAEIELPAPWYEYFPLDFLAEHLWPFPLRDEHHLAVTLTRRAPVTDEELEALYGRAQARRRQESPSLSGPDESAP